MGKGNLYYGHFLFYLVRADRNDILEKEKDSTVSTQYALQLCVCVQLGAYIMLSKGRQRQEQSYISTPYLRKTKPTEWREA